MISRGQIEEIRLQPQGRLDLQGGERLQQQLETIAPRRYKIWVIDLSEVEFIDSPGLSALISGLELARESNARLVLCSLRPSAQLIFEITQLDRAFDIFESYDVLLTALIIPESIIPALEVA
ncbi:anti-sigma factor antagonist [Phormidesmis priestleyi ULC007]|uniref:Anti-sigma factor antagonist n=1 Tax=Phormidesmis priestleyi ULC007 TaxID=1920490 RepID=A0A2T1DF52_9CYAN|nr:STAS domain-containing protein [Phormidesmis priestleyi]PSB19129.1 anti-sigma factor antagonist [Phormidesmis priestleyi ULC007]PZO49981.1 MAG: anti-sigma factor antagonist [Phormidesmis priestleyi]